jgi:hypothetical protein
MQYISRPYRLAHRNAYPLEVVPVTDTDKQVAKLTHLIEGHVNHVAQQIEPEVVIEPGSMGAREQANTETGPGGPWGDIPPHTALSLAKMKLTVAADHIGSLHKLLQPPLPLFGLMVMARASLEASAKAYWLLDPSISVRDRVARELGDRLDSAREQRDALRLLSQGQVDSAEVTAVEAEAAALGVTAKLPPSMTTLAWRTTSRASAMARATTSTCVPSLTTPTTPPSSTSRRWGLPSTVGARSCAAGWV